MRPLKLAAQVFVFGSAISREISERCAGRVATEMGLAPWAAECVAGFCGGAAKTAIFYPLDTLTTLREVSLWGGGAALSLRGAGGAYSGVGAALAGAAPYALLFHGAFWLVSSAPLLDGLPPATVQMLAGTCGALAAAVVGVPFECVKHRLQVGSPGYRLALLRTLRAEGLGSVYAGLGSTLARNVPYNALHFGTFAAARRGLRAARCPAGAATPAAAALAGALTALVTTPLDLVNTRMQTQAVLARAAGARPYAGVGQAIRRIVAEEGGAAALWQGAAPRVANYAPSAVVFFVVYEHLRRSLL